MLHRLSLTDGSLRPASKTETTPARWTEATLQHVALLNPDLLGVADQLPLVLDGETTSVSVDQVFIDDVGRITFVEFKNERADLPALAQLLSYGMHWSGYPTYEIDAGLRHATRKLKPEDILAKSLGELRSWAKATSSRTSKRSCPWTRWPAAHSTRKLGQGYWGPKALAMMNAPVRVVLVAPDFGEGTVKLAKLLGARYVAIELVRAELRRDSEGGVYLAWEHVVVPPDDIETTWRAASLVWRGVPALRARFRTNAWADHISKSSFSLSPIAAPAVRIWIETEADSVSLSTAIPDGWYRSTPKKREALRAKLLERVPAGHDGGRYLEWTVPAARSSHIVDVMKKIVSAVEQVLVPAAPTD